MNGSLTIEKRARRWKGRLCRSATKCGDVGALALGLEAVANTADGDDVPRMGWVGFDLVS